MKKSITVDSDWVSAWGIMILVVLSAASAIRDVIRILHPSQPLELHARDWSLPLLVPIACALAISLARCYADRSIKFAAGLYVLHSALYLIVFVPNLTAGVRFFLFSARLFTGLGINVFILVFAANWFRNKLRLA